MSGVKQDLSLYTRTDHDDHDVAKAVIARTLSNEAVGKRTPDGEDNTISSSELAERVSEALPPEKHIGASAVRDLIPQVTLEYRLPIGNSNGYFVIDSRDEANRQIERQKQRARTSRQRAQAIAAAWNQSKGVGDEKERPN